MAETVTIGRMRVQSGGDYEPLALRLRLSHLMATAEFQPVGIPPQATLLVRRVTLSSPLNVEGLRISQTWQANLREIMTRYYRSAVHPRNGMIPFDAESVLFEEQAELIAALSRMIVDPVSEAVWVWHSATKSADAPNTERLFRLWHEVPRLIPAVLTYLENWHIANTVLNRFSEPMQLRICHDMLTEWEIPFSEADLRTLTQMLILKAAHPSSRSPFVAEQQQKTDELSKALPFSLPNEFQQERANSTPTVQAVRILAFLHRTSVSKSQLQQKFHAFIQAAQHWQVEQSEIEQQAQQIPHEESLSVLRSETTQSQTFNETESNAIELVQEKQITSTALGEESREAEPANIIQDKNIESESERQTASKLWNGLQGRETHLGGVFYLLNVIVSSNALSSFAKENTDKKMPSIWPLLEAFAQSLLAESVVSFENDALWQLLAQWDQQEVKTAAEFSQQNQTLAEICQLLRRELMARLRWNEIDLHENIVSFLAVPATVYATSVHIDVVFPLHRIDMTARIAGLDASPGWIAEILRVVLFHFE